MHIDVDIDINTTLNHCSCPARGDLKAVRSLVELGEPYMDNHCEHLEAEIDRATKELEAAAKKLRELSSLKEQLSPELERLKVGELQLTLTSVSRLTGSHGKVIAYSIPFFFMPPDYFRAGGVQCSCVRRIAKKVAVRTFIKWHNTETNGRGMHNERRTNGCPSYSPTMVEHHTANRSHARTPTSSPLNNIHPCLPPETQTRHRLQRIWRAVARYNGRPREALELPAPASIRIGMAKRHRRDGQGPIRPPYLRGPSKRCRAERCASSGGVCRGSRF